MSVPIFLDLERFLLFHKVVFWTLIRIGMLTSFFGREKYIDDILVQRAEPICAIIRPVERDRKARSGGRGAIVIYTLRDAIAVVGCICLGEETTIVIGRALQLPGVVSWSEIEVSVKVVAFGDCRY